VVVPNHCIVEHVEWHTAALSRRSYDKKAHCSVVLFTGENKGEIHGIEQI